jgi:hypothetical protein
MWAGAGAFCNAPRQGTRASVRGVWYIVKLGVHGQPRPVLVFESAHRIQAGAELTYDYTPVFSAQHSLLTMSPCNQEQLDLYRRVMPHLTPDSMYGSDARYFTLLQAHDAKVALNVAARAKLAAARASLSDMQP